MPIYDYIYGTVDKNSNTLYENSVERKEESPNVVHLTHLTTPESIYHLRLGFAYLASKLYSSEPLRSDQMTDMGIHKYRVQGEELNRYGEVYVKKHPQLKVKDGSSLAVAVLLNSIPKGTTQVLLRGNLTEVAFAVTFALCQKGIQVIVLREDEYEKLDKSFGTKSEDN
ncbi:hypothetical protein Gorai_008137, partial [Gossypium raimondii]|nr:hypothetical protein [Gossypium raimondii]